MNDAAIGLAIGMIISFCITANTGVTEHARDLRTECEAELPRHQNCVMRYIVEDE